MTFTIPAFWCGVLATILAEFLAIVIYGIIHRNK